MAVATQGHTGSVSQTKMDFWGGMGSVFMMPSITPTERRAVWDALSSYIQRQLLQHKGVRVPTLGSFDVVCTETRVGDRTVMLQSPVFYLARNLGGVYSSGDNKDDLSGDKQLEPLKYAKVAVEASVSRSKAESCILGTTSLLYHCLRKGESITLVLRDLGVLVIEGRKAQMRFYPDFLEKMTGKNSQEKAIFKVLQQLDVVVSRGVPVASLASTSRVVTFPEFEPASLPMSLHRDPPRALRHIPGEDKGKEKEGLPPLRRGMEERCPSLSVPALSSTAKAGKQPWGEGEPEGKGSSGVRRPPVIPGAAAGKKQSVTDQDRGKPAPKGQGSKQSHGEAAATQRGRGGREGQARDSLRREGEKRVLLGREGEQKDPLRRGGKKEGAEKDPFGKEGENEVSSERKGEKKVPLTREGRVKDPLGKEGEREVHPGKEGKKKVNPGRQREMEDPLGKEGEKVHSGKEGEKKVNPRKEGEKKINPRREGEKEVSSERKGEKKVPLKREGRVKDPLGTERERKVHPGKEGEVKDPLEKEGEQDVSPGRKAGKKVHFEREAVKDPLGRKGRKKLLPRREERKAPVGSRSPPRVAQARELEGFTPKIFVLQRLRPEAEQGLRARPEAFWSVLKEPQKSILAGYRFEPSLFVPSLRPEGPPSLQCPMLRKKDVVSRGLWPWME